MTNINLSTLEVRMKVLRNIVVSAVLLVCIATTPEPSEAAQRLTCSRAEHALLHSYYGESAVSTGDLIGPCERLSQTRVIFKLDGTDVRPREVIEARLYRGQIVVLPYR